MSDTGSEGKEFLLEMISSRLKVRSRTLQSELKDRRKTSAKKQEVRQVIRACSVFV